VCRLYIIRFRSLIALVKTPKNLWGAQSDEISGPGSAFIEMDTAIDSDLYHRTLLCIWIYIWYRSGYLRVPTTFIYIRKRFARNGNNHLVTKSEAWGSLLLLLQLDVFLCWHLGIRTTVFISRIERYTLPGRHWLHTKKVRKRKKTTRSVLENLTRAS